MGRRFAHQRPADSRESIRKEMPIFEALGQILANRVFSLIRIEVRVIRVQSSLLSHYLEGRFAKKTVSGKIPGTSQIPLFETQARQTFEGGHELFGHHPFAWKTPTPPGGLRTQKLIFVLFFLA